MIGIKTEVEQCGDMQIIIVGCGNVGSTLAEQLSKEGHDISVIDERSDILQSVVNNSDVMGIVGNGASYSTMKDAGIEAADLMIAVTDSDELNLLCCLIAKKAGNCHTIARVRNPVYKREIGFIKEELGLSMVINPEEAAANEAARLLKFPSANKIETFARGRAELIKLSIEEESVLCNKSLKEIQSELRSKVLIGIVSRGEEIFIPDGNFVLRARDEISVIGSTRDMIAFFKRIKMPTAGVHSCIIVSGGETAYYLAGQLLSVGVDVRIFERSRERCKELATLLPEALVIHADGTDKDRLMEEGLTTVESFVALTDLDEENIMLSMFVHSLSKKAKRITKVHRAGYEDIIGSLDVGSVLYPKNITAERIVQYVRGMSNSFESNIETLYRMDDGRVEVLEFLIREDAPVLGVPLQNIQLKKGILVACINHRGEITIPGGQSKIAVGDTVIVVTTSTGFHDISDILA